MIIIMVMFIIRNLKVLISIRMVSLVERLDGSDDIVLVLCLRCTLVLYYLLKILYEYFRELDFE